MQSHSIIHYSVGTQLSPYSCNVLWQRFWPKHCLLFFYWFILFYLDSSCYWLATQIYNLLSALTSICYCVTLKETLLECSLCKELEPLCSSVKKPKAIVTVSNAILCIFLYKTNGSQQHLNCVLCTVSSAWENKCSLLFQHIKVSRVTLAASFGC